MRSVSSEDQIAFQATNVLRKNAYFVRSTTKEPSDMPDASMEPS